MIRRIRTVKHDRQFLETPCLPVGMRAENVTQDLLDTANALSNRCAGLAANQIGYQYRAFAIKQGNHYIVLLNPKIVDKSEKTTISRERCLSLPGRKPALIRRHKIVTVEYDLIGGGRAKEKFKGMDAFIAQHEINHCDGKLI